jgi:hypothetical protein
MGDQLATQGWGTYVAVLMCVLSLSACSHAEPPDKEEPVATPTKVHLPRAQIHRIQRNLVSGSEQRVRRVVELPPGEPLDETFVPSLEGLVIVFDQSTAVAAGPDQVVVAATVTQADGATTQWQVTLDRIKGRYLIADTRAVAP